MLGNEPKSSLRPFEQYLKGISDFLGNAHRVLKTSSAKLSGERRHFGKCTKNSGLKMGAFPTRFSAKRKQEDLLAYHPEDFHIF